MPQPVATYIIPDSHSLRPTGLESLVGRNLGLPDDFISNFNHSMDSPTLPLSVKKTLARIAFKDGSTVRKRCRHGNFHHAIDNAIEVLISRSIKARELGHTPMLLLAQQIAVRLLQGGLSVDVGPKNTTTTRLVITLQKQHPILAVHVAAAALKAGVALTSDTLCATIAEAAASAHSPKDIAAVASLAELGIQKSLIQLHSPGVVEVFDFLLGSCGEPRVTGDRISVRYAEVDVLDAAGRLNSLAPLVQLLITKGIPFHTDRTVDRIDMFVRSLCSLALVLDIERLRMFGALPSEEVAALKKVTGVQLEWPAVSGDRLEQLDPALLSNSLVSAAVSIVDLSLKEDRGLGQGYEISGRTINYLFNACFFDEIGLDADQVTALRSILERAVNIPRVRRRLRSAHIENGVLSTLAATRYEAEPEPLFLDSAAMLTTAMRSGFAFLRSRIEMVYERCAHSIHENNPSERWTEDARFLLSKINRISCPSTSSLVKATPAIGRELLKGGIDSSDPRCLHSFEPLLAASLPHALP